jgi:hypothetical protein
MVPGEQRVQGKKKVSGTIPVLRLIETGKGNGQIIDGGKTRDVLQAPVSWLERLPDIQSGKKVPWIAARYGKEVEELATLIRRALIENPCLKSNTLAAKARQPKTLPDLNITLKPDRLIAALSQKVTGARLVMWQSKHSGCIHPGIFCPKFATVLYALAICALEKPADWKICKRCDKPFLRRRTNQVYCTIQCQAADAMKRKRDREKPKKNLKAQREARGE